MNSALEDLTRNLKKQKTMELEESKGQEGHCGDQVGVTSQEGHCGDQVGVTSNEGMTSQDGVTQPLKESVITPDEEIWLPYSSKDAMTSQDGMTQALKESETPKDAVPSQDGVTLALEESVTPNDDMPPGLEKSVTSAGYNIKMFGKRRQTPNLPDLPDTLPRGKKVYWCKLRSNCKYVIEQGKCTYTHNPEEWNKLMEKREAYKAEMREKYCPDDDDAVETPCEACDPDYQSGGQWCWKDWRNWTAPR